MDDMHAASEEARRRAVEQIVVAIEGGDRVLASCAAADVPYDVFRDWLSQFPSLDARYHRCAITDRFVRMGIRAPDEERVAILTSIIETVERGSTVLAALDQSPIADATFYTWLRDFPDLKARLRRKTATASPEERRAIIEGVLRRIKYGVPKKLAFEESPTSYSSIYQWVGDFPDLRERLGGTTSWGHSVDDRKRIIEQVIADVAAGKRIGQAYRDAPVGKNTLRIWIQQYPYLKTALAAARAKHHNSPGPIPTPPEERLRIMLDIVEMMEKGAPFIVAIAASPISKTTFRKWRPDFPDLHVRMRAIGLLTGASGEKADIAVERREKIERVIDAMQKGMARSTAIRAVGVNPRSFTAWLDEHPDLSDRLDRLDRDPTALAAARSARLAGTRVIIERILTALEGGMSLNEAMTRESFYDRGFRRALDDMPDLAHRYEAIRQGVDDRRRPALEALVAAMQGGRTFKDALAQVGISKPTAYKWLRDYPDLAEQYAEALRH